MSAGQSQTAPTLYTVGGKQRQARTLSEREVDWYRFGQGLILEVEPDTGDTREVVSYVSPPDVCAPDDPAILFKGAALCGDEMYVCTPTEVLVYELPGFELRRYISLPAFNDLHHARPDSHGNLLVAVTGLDLVLAIDQANSISDYWSVAAGHNASHHIGSSVDFRLVASTKPHMAHPNQLFLIDDEPWVTRFEQRDAVSLRSPARRINIGCERVHDGYVDGGWVYFTTVDGRIAVASTTTLIVEDVLDLNEMSGTLLGDRHLGWCRGLYIDGPRAWVGFSRLRLSRVRANLSWVRWGFKPFAPTRIACYDLERRCLVHEVDLQRHGLDAIFSILPAS